jgi:hypothetical protein
MCSRPSVRNKSIIEAIREDARSALQLRCKRSILDHVVEETEMGSRASSTSYNKTCPFEYGEERKVLLLRTTYYVRTNLIDYVSKMGNAGPILLAQLRFCPMYHKRQCW